jgi:hypothetical protein
VVVMVRVRVISHRLNHEGPGPGQGERAVVRWWGNRRRQRWRGTGASAWACRACPRDSQ